MTIAWCDLQCLVQSKAARTGLPPILSCWSLLTCLQIAAGGQHGLHKHHHHNHHRHHHHHHHRQATTCAHSSVIPWQHAALHVLCEQRTLSKNSPSFSSHCSPACSHHRQHPHSHKPSSSADEGRTNGGSGGGSNDGSGVAGRAAIPAQPLLSSSITDWPFAQPARCRQWQWWPRVCGWQAPAHGPGQQQRRGQRRWPPGRRWAHCHARDGWRWDGT